MNGEPADITTTQFDFAGTRRASRTGHARVSRQVVNVYNPTGVNEAMGFLFRKSFRLGPLRLNLSKRGVGASIAVKGARVGIDSSGCEYVAGGRHGFYFRERGSRVGVGVLAAIVVGTIGALAIILAGCPSMPRPEQTVPAATPTIAPEVPPPDAPRPELDRGHAAPGSVS